MLVVKPISEGEREWAKDLLIREWSSTTVVTRGKIHKADSLPGFVAFWRRKPAGLVTYEVDGDSCEVVTLNAEIEGRGIGSTLLGAVEEKARELGCGRVWLVTTNDNCHALSFYQSKGYQIAAFHLGAVALSRKLKPSIPETGLNGIPIRDEIELFKMI